MNSIIIGRKGRNIAGYSSVYVGRPSLLGNPFEMCCEKDRNNVIKEYRLWLGKQFENNSLVWKEIEKLSFRIKNGEKLNLQCYCSPKPCHADVIKSAILYILNLEKIND